MPLQGFYNQNAGRAYPLVPRSNALLGVSVPPLATQISNWNASNVVVTVAQWTAVVGTGRGSGHWLSLSPSAGGAGSVTWPFAVVPGRTYRISATWPGDPNQASNARYTAVETEGAGQGYFPLLEIRVDQRVPPSQHVDQGAGWLDLGVVTPIRSTLLVAVNDDSDAPAVADAIWVEDVTPADPAAIVALVPPPETLVDFGCLVGLDAEFDSGAHLVYLHQITRAGTTFTFDFRSDAPGLLEYALIFRRTLGDPEYATDYAAAVPLEGAQGPAEAPGLLWEGFLVTGPLDSLAAVLPADGALAATTGPQVEPALVQNLGRSYVRSINLANQDRTHATAPAGCPGSDAPGGDLPYIVSATGLTGDLRFMEGYNLAVRQNALSNSLTFSSIQGAGDGEPCNTPQTPNGEVPLYPDEQPPDGSTLLGGGPTCNESINSINGLTASVIRFVPGLGAQIVPSPDDPNTLIVDLSGHNMTVCGPVTVVREELADD